MDWILTLLTLPIIAAQIVTTFILGILVEISLGLLLLPISLVWIILFAPLVGGSWLCGRARWLRNLIGLVGIPWAVIAHIYVCLMPSMGELESRAAKMLLTEAWPFSWEFWQFQTGQSDIGTSEDQPLHKILARISCGDPLKQRTLYRLARREQLDSNL